jgi:hypothetical protein
MRPLCLALLLILCCVVSFAGTQVPNDPGEPGVITGTVIDPTATHFRMQESTSENTTGHKLGRFDMSQQAKTVSSAS